MGGSWGVIIFMKMVTMSFLMKVPLSLKMGRDDENRLMSRVLPRPLVLQGGKSMGSSIRTLRKIILMFCSSFESLKRKVFDLFGLFFANDLPPWKTSGRGRTLDMRRFSSPNPFYEKIPIFCKNTHFRYEKPSIRILTIFSLK